MSKQRRRIGDLFLEAGLVTPAQLEEALVEQRATGEFVGQVLVRRGWATEHAICECLRRQLNLPVVQLKDLQIPDHVLALVSEKLATRYLAMPLSVDGPRDSRSSSVVVAMADPLNPAALEDIRFYSGYYVRPVLAPASAIAEAINRCYRLDATLNEVLEKIISDDEVPEVRRLDGSAGAEPAEALLKEGQSRPIVRLADWILAKAVAERASDVHLEPQEREVLLRLRVDGLLRELERLPNWVQSPLVSRLKVLAGLDISERRRPQEGRFQVEIAERAIEVNLSTLPVAYGEKVAARILDLFRTPADLHSLGLQSDDLGRVKALLARPQGLLLVSGPTGSGKSTALYSFLRHLYSEHTSLVTVEDPIEYPLPRVAQVELDSKSNRSFSGAVSAALSQDPDVLMIGELKDAETAQLAYRAAITGHLVLSAVCTNDGASAVTRLLDVGLQPFLVASAVQAVLAIRLVRTICPKCREAYDLDPAEARGLGLRAVNGEAIVVYRGAGCEQCRFTGYYGRTGLFEILELNDELRELIAQGAPDSAVRLAALDLGMRSMADDGIQKVLAGVTTWSEIHRVVRVADEFRRLCPYCTTVLAGDFNYCTSCGHFVSDHCVQCRRRLNGHWSYCPFCGTTNSARRTEARSLGHGIQRQAPFGEARGAEAMDEEALDAAIEAAIGSEEPTSSAPAPAGRSRPAENPDAKVAQSLASRSAARASRAKRGR
jgi:type IV pilus assembly protein PilB